MDPEFGDRAPIQQGLREDFVLKSADDRLGGCGKFADFIHLAQQIAVLFALHAGRRYLRVHAGFDFFHTAGRHVDHCFQDALGGLDRHNRNAGPYDGAGCDFQFNNSSRFGRNHIDGPFQFFFQRVDAPSQRIDPVGIFRRRLVVLVFHPNLLGLELRDLRLQPCNLSFQLSNFLEILNCRLLGNQTFCKQLFIYRNLIFGQFDLIVGVSNLKLQGRALSACGHPIRVLRFCARFPGNAGELFALRAILHAPP